MGKEALKFKFDKKKFLKDVKSVKGLAINGVSLGLLQSLQIMTNEINSKITGPKKYPKSFNIRLLQRAKGKGGLAKDLVGRAFGMAINIAKEEGHSSFTHGGAGWSRVKELFPSMPVVRPKGKQILWIQSGNLRKSQKLSVVDATGKKRGTRTNLITVGKAIAKGVLFNTTDYGKKFEAGKKPFMAPVMRRFISSGKLLKVIDRNIQRELKKVGKK